MSAAKRRADITFVEEEPRGRAPAPPRSAEKKSHSLLLGVEQRDGDSTPRVSAKALEIMERKRLREEAQARKRAELADARGGFIRSPLKEQAGGDVVRQEEEQKAPIDHLQGNKDPAIPMLYQHS